jgi:hypothetical protein
MFVKFSHIICLAVLFIVATNAFCETDPVQAFHEKDLLKKMGQDYLMQFLDMKEVDFEDPELMKNMTLVLPRDVNLPYKISIIKSEAFSSAPKLREDGAYNDDIYALVYLKEKGTGFEIVRIGDQEDVDQIIQSSTADESLAPDTQLEQARDLRNLLMSTDRNNYRDETYAINAYFVDALIKSRTEMSKSDADFFGANETKDSYLLEIGSTNRDEDDVEIIKRGNEVTVKYTRDWSAPGAENEEDQSGEDVHEVKYRIRKK